MAVDSSVLYQEAKCFLCLGISQAESLSLALQIRWLLSLNPLADTTLNTLLSESNCLRCYTNVSMFNLLSIALLRKIQVATIVDSFVARAEITSDAQISALNGLVESALENGWWAKCDLIYPFVGGTALAHSQNLKSSNFTITWNGTLTHDANGITGDGVSSYGNTGYNPAINSSILSLNSAHLGLYRRTRGSDNRNYFGCNNLSLRVFTGLQFRAAVNDPTLSFFTVPTDFMQWMMATRINSTQKHIYNGPNTVNVTLSSSAVSSTSMILLNSSVAGANWSDANISGMTVGSGITFAEYELMAADWQTFQTALGRQV